MREEYSQRLERKGAGRPFHSLRAPGDEIAYVNQLVQMVNSGKEEDEVPMSGHSAAWLEAYGRRGERLKAIFGRERESSVDERIVGLMNGC